MIQKLRTTVALFGEAEKGQFKKPYLLRALPQLVDAFGNPPAESQGLFFAVQALLYKRDLIYFRVEEEGYSLSDYLHGLKYLEDKEKTNALSAICLPGVGEPAILDVSQRICEIHSSILITSQKDLYDYLTGL